MESLGTEKEFDRGSRCILGGRVLKDTLKARKGDGVVFLPDTQIEVFKDCYNKSRCMFDKKRSIDSPIAQVD